MILSRRSFSTLATISAMEAFTIDLLAIFLKLLKTFSGCSKRFRGIAMMENIRGQEKKIKSGPGGWKELKQKFLKIESAIKTY
jgi:hypothetical protein